MNWKVRGRKRPWPNLRHYLSRHRRNPRETTGYSVSRMRFETASSERKSETLYLEATCSHTVVYSPNWFCFTIVLLSGVCRGFPPRDSVVLSVNMTTHFPVELKCGIHGAFPLCRQYICIVNTGGILTVLSIGRTSNRKTQNFLKAAHRTDNWCMTSAQACANRVKGLVCS
jgi:hypothetical protein